MSAHSSSARRPSGTRTAGIIGGMGPQATIDLMQRIIDATPATDDTDHIRMIVDNNPKVPSRIRALIEGDGADPGPHIAAMAAGLETAGADFLAIACNTAHRYHGVAAAAVVIPVLNVVDLSIARIADLTPVVDTVGMLASPAVQLTALFESAANSRRLTLLYPSVKDQAALLQTIRAVKAGNVEPAQLAACRAAAASLVSEGAQLLLIACSELSVIADDLCTPVPVIDTMELLADAIILKATS